MRINWNNPRVRGAAMINDVLFFAVPNGVEIVKVQTVVFESGGPHTAAPLIRFRIDYKRFISNDRYN